VNWGPHVAGLIRAWDHLTWAELEDKALGQSATISQLLLEALGLDITTVILGEEVFEMLTEEK
jgi:hypothetical protein